MITFLALSSTTYARQYIQCHTTDTNSTDVMVVNLDNEKSTLFLSSGMQNPEDERVLMKIELKRTDSNYHVFRAINFDKDVEVSVPSEIIGKRVRDFLIDLKFDEYQLTYSCFSALYE